MMVCGLVSYLTGSTQQRFGYPIGNGHKSREGCPVLCAQCLWWSVSFWGEAEERGALPNGSAPEKVMIESVLCVSSHRPNMSHRSLLSLNNKIAIFSALLPFSSPSYCTYFLHSLTSQVTIPRVFLPFKSTPPTRACRNKLS